MVLVSNLVTMQQQPSRAVHHHPPPHHHPHHHPHRVAAPDDNEYVELPLTATTTTTAVSSPEQSHNMVNGFQLKDHGHNTGHSNYRSNSLTRRPNSNTNNDSNTSTSGHHRTHQSSTVDVVRNNRSHQHHNHHYHHHIRHSYHLESSSSNNNSNGLNQILTTQNGIDHDIDTQRDSPSLNFNHEKLFYQPSISNDIETKQQYANSHQKDDCHRQNHQDHRQSQHSSPAHHRHSYHSHIPNSSVLPQDNNLSSHSPVRPSRPSSFQQTFPQPSSSSSLPSSSSQSPHRPSAILPRQSASPSSPPSSSSSLSSSRNYCRHNNTTSTAMTRSTAQREKQGHRTDPSSVIAKQSDTPLVHAHNTFKTSAVNQRDNTPATAHSNHSSVRNSYSGSSNKTHLDTHYHHHTSPSSVTDQHVSTSWKVNEKNGRDKTIDFAMKSGYFTQNGRITNSKTENSVKRDVISQVHTLDQSSSTKSNKSPKNSTEASNSSSTQRLSAVMDIPMASITSADSWSPSYIKMDFFMANGDSSSNPSPVSSTGYPTTSSGSKDLRKSALKNGYKSHILSNSFDSSASTNSSSRIFENGNRSHDSSQENMSRSDNSSASSRHEYQHHHEEMTTHHARLLTVNRSSLDSKHFSSNGNGISPVFDSVCGTLPQKVKNQFLRRSVSHEPQQVESKMPILRTSSDGEIESEYVTLDHSYFPFNNSGHCMVNEIVVGTSSTPPHSSLTVLPTTTATNTQSGHIIDESVSSEQSKNIKRIHNPVFTNEDSNIKSDNRNSSMAKTLPTSINLVKPKRNMRQNLLKMNSFPHNSWRQVKSTNNAGNLCTVVENDVATSSVTNPLYEPFSTLPRTRSSFAVDTRSSPHTFDYRGSNVIENNERNNTPQPLDSMHEMPPPTTKPIIPKSILIRSKSLPDLQQVNDDLKENTNSKNGNTANNNYSDDEDGDEFGFLSYPISFPSCSTATSSSTVMQKAKSPSPSSRILPKRWRTTKAKAVPGVSCTAMWTPGPLGSCMWSSVSGRKVVLRPESILSLSEAERIALQKVAFAKLHEIALECPVVIPKDATDVRRSKKSALSLKRRSKSVNLSPHLNSGKESSGMVFGIPITKCIKNDREMEKKRLKMVSSMSTTPSAAASPAAKIRTDWTENATTPRSTRKSSSSSQGSLDKSSSTQNGTMGMQRQDTLTVPSCKRAASSDSLSESESSRNTSSSLIDALSLSASCPASRLSSIVTDRIMSANQGELQVPNLVNTCFRHIQTYGLQTLGIFRVGCSKKRVKELREEFDSGKDVELREEEHHPHDVGALLKEYFRDMPEPLLTRELYLPFLHAKRLTNEHKRSTAMQLLISMLPVANRDTLWALLQFLATVSQHAGDSINEKGETVPGNKMDSHNLATLFGPNILHRTKSMDKDHSMESAESVVESKEVIQVVKDMIENHHELYEISGSLRDDVLRMIIESDQEIADRILKQLANQNQIEADPESMCSVFEDSTGSPVLSHAMNSDADFFAYAKKQSSVSQRPLRVTKSVEDNLDSPLSKTRATHFSDSYANSSTHDLKMPSSTTHPFIHQDMMAAGYPSPTPNRIPVLQLPHDSSPDTSPPTTAEVILRNRLDLSSNERPYSESFSQNLSIPKPIYLRESSNSSVSSCLSSSQNSHRDSDGNNHSGYWALPTPPASRGASPKPLVRSASSSSTLIPSPSPVKLSHSQSEDYNDANHTKGSAEWEKERWRHWEMMASEKRNSEAEQETLV